MLALYAKYPQAGTVDPTPPAGALLYRWRDCMQNRKSCQSSPHHRVHWTHFQVPGHIKSAIIH